MTDSLPMLKVKHIELKVVGDRIHGTCSICQMGIDAGPRFGPVSGEVLVAAWVKQHTHKPKRNGGPA